MRIYWASILGVYLLSLVYMDAIAVCCSQLGEKKKEMARIIEISNKAYEARDAAQATAEIRPRVSLAHRTITAARPLAT